MPYIRSFKIVDLFGYRTIALNQKADYVILVGENGSGKTTMMNCLYYLLTQKFDELVKVDFKSIEITFNTGKKFSFNHSEIMPKERMPLSITERRFVTYLSEVLKFGEVKQLTKILANTDKSISLIDSIKEYFISKKIQFARYSNETILKSVTALLEETKAYLFEQRVSEFRQYTTVNVKYLPTFRRVETYMENMNDSNSNSESFMQFGMKDVQETITKYENEINQRNKDGFNNMMVNLINRLYLKDNHEVSFSYPIEKMKLILSRLGGLLSNDLREKVLDYCKSDTHSNNELDYLLEELVKLYETQEDLDNSIREFCEKCNGYLRNKHFEYDEVNVKVQVKSDANDEYIGLESLSSGEKQIVAMMSELYLSDDKEYVILVDEPELSLSIDWQKRLLPDFVASKKCKYLMAVTHSPFIYSNSLQDYAVGMSNFIKE